MELVTGYAGEAHVTSGQAGLLNAGIVSVGQVVLALLDEFKATVESDTSVTISSGVLLNQGRQAVINYGETETLSVTAGTSGTYRRDLIVAAYSKDASTLIETCELKVITGTSASSSSAAADPSYTSGDLLAGDTYDEMPLYRIVMDGTTLDSVEQMFDVMKPLGDIGSSKVWYAYCTNSASTTAKTVTTYEDGFELKRGVIIAVKFTYTNNSGTPTLNVNSTGAANIRRAYGSNGYSTDLANAWQGGAIVFFIYTGTYWWAVGQEHATTAYYGTTKLSDSVTDTSTGLAATANAVKQAYDLATEAKETADSVSNSSNGNGIFYATCGTAAATNAKVATCSNTGFTLIEGVTVAVKFTYTNSGSTPTLNVDGTGALSIKAYGTTTVSTSMWHAGSIVMFTYDGSYWLMENEGTGSTSYYGKVKLSASTSSTNGASSGYAATPSAVKEAYDLANTANTTVGDIGTTYSSTTTITCSSGGVDTYVAGDSITLPAGTYVVVARGTFTSNTTEGQRRVSLYNSTSGASVATTVLWTNGWASGEATNIVTLTGETEYACRLSTGIGSSLSSCTALIQAVRIK